MDDADTLETELRQFFSSFTTRSRSSFDAGPERFADPFMSADPTSFTMVTREQLRAALPMRARMFSSIGATGSVLRCLTLHPVDDKHVLVETAWDVEFVGDDAAPLVLHSTYLLRRGESGWQVLVYINQQNLPALIAERVEAAPTWQAPAAGPTRPLE